jgi:hypothetical protein
MVNRMFNSIWNIISFPLPLFPFSIINQDFSHISICFQASGGLGEVRIFLTLSHLKVKTY